MSPAVQAVAVVVAVGYAVVNAFGSWAVARRRASIGGAFFAAASFLIVGAVAVAFGLPGALPLVTVGVVTASLTSWWNARAVLRRVVPWRHALRAAAGLVVVALTLWAVGAR